MSETRRAVLLLAHGTVRHGSELPEFLTRVRRGRPPGPELVREIERRYAAIGGSPLLDVTEEQARRLQAAVGVPCRVAMRLWHPTVEEGVPELLAQGVEELCLLPMAPFSVPVYVSAARAALANMGEPASRLVSVGVTPWGQHPGFIAAQVAQIVPFLQRRGDERLVLTAHSLPQSVIDAGDDYAIETARSAEHVAGELGVQTVLAYQSQGPDGEWLGPMLEDVLQAAAHDSVRRVVVAPFGFVADHVETLYDLDVEARALAEQLGMEFVRVPALNAVPTLIDTLAQLVRDAFGVNGTLST